MTGRITLLEAYVTVLIGDARRICKPGRWVVFHDGARVVVEHFS